METGSSFKDLLEKHSMMTNIVITTVLMTVATMAAAAFFHYSQNSTSVAIVYVLTVMLVARYTSGYVPGIVASVVGVVCVNYVFTYPFMKMNFTMDGYPVTFLGMLVISGITSTLTTKFKRQSQLLTEREKMLMEAEKETMRANLLRAVSHDLRTPLTAVIGLSNAYLDGGEQLSEEDKRQMLKGIQEEAGWLLNMVENLLSVTRIRVGDVKIATSPEPLEEVVSEAVQRLHKRLPQAAVRVRVPDEFLMVPVDAALIEQVIINLLENAVYHSGVAEGIDFFVEKEEKVLEFHIRDYGKGISQERLERIFDGAGMESNESGDSHKGMGIGLTICKTIITAHQGSIQAFNRDPGAEFVFTLPLGEDL